MDVRYPHGTESRSSKLMCLKNAHKTSTSLFGAIKSVNEKALHASFKVSWEVARAQKPYTLVELITKCGIIMAKEIRNDLLSYHCIIHQENLAALYSAPLIAVMNDVITSVNYIKSHALNHGQFKAILKEYDSNYGELVYHSEVRWLSKGAVLDHYFHLFEVVKQFFSEKSEHLPEKIVNIIPKLYEKDWIEKLGFLTDITDHLNALNKQLQGKDKIVCNMIGHITAFESKLKLFQMQLKAHNCGNFEKLQFLNLKYNLKNCDLFSTCIEDLMFEFNSRFMEFREKQILFTLIADPWIVLPEELHQCQPYIKEEHIGIIICYLY